MTIGLAALICACVASAGIAALYWDQTPDATTQDIWNQIMATAIPGVVKNARGPRDSVASTMGTFTSEPETNFRACPLPPLPLAPSPVPPPAEGGGSSGEEAPLWLLIVIAVLLACIIGIAGAWCYGQYGGSTK